MSDPIQKMSDMLVANDAFSATLDAEVCDALMWHAVKLREALRNIQAKWQAQGETDPRAAGEWMASLAQAALGEEK